MWWEREGFLCTILVYPGGCPVPSPSPCQYGVVLVKSGQNVCRFYVAEIPCNHVVGGPGARSAVS